MMAGKLKETQADMDLNPQDSRPRTKWMWRIFLLNLLLVGSHLGEFWPFSIFPMFSKADQPWSRAMIVDIPLVDSYEDPSAMLWEPMDIDIHDLQAISLKEMGIDKIDFSNYVGKTKQWTPELVIGIVFVAFVMQLILTGFPWVEWLTTLKQKSRMSLSSSDGSTLKS